MKHNLKDSYKISGFVRLGACINTLITLVMGDIEYLMNKDIVFFWGGEVQMILAKIIPKVIKTHGKFCRNH
jgi:hypothetical protein